MSFLEAMKDRVRELRALRDEQQQLIEHHRQALRTAEVSLQIIQGGLQDCQFWSDFHERNAQSEIAEKATGGRLAGLPPTAGSLLENEEGCNGQPAVTASS